MFSRFLNDNWDNWGMNNTKLNESHWIKNLRSRLWVVLGLVFEEILCQIFNGLRGSVFWECCHTMKQDGNHGLIQVLTRRHWLQIHARSFRWWTVIFILPVRLPKKEQMRVTNQCSIQAHQHMKIKGKGITFASSPFPFPTALGISGMDGAVHWDPSTAVLESTSAKELIYHFESYDT